MKHTPTPWAIRGKHEIVGGPALMRQIAECFNGPNKHSGTDSDNAAFIVEACSSYEKHVQQIQHLDSALKAQAATVARLEKEKEALRKLIDGAVGRIYDIVSKHGGDIEGVTSGRITRCATLLNKNALALCEEAK